MRALRSDGCVALATESAVSPTSHADSTPPIVRHRTCLLERPQFSEIDGFDYTAHGVEALNLMTGAFDDEAIGDDRGDLSPLVILVPFLEAWLATNFRRTLEAVI